MKKLILFTISFVFATLLAAQVNNRPVRNAMHSGTNVMTFNIRYNNTGDGINKWDNRKELAINTILENNVDILGIQEALHSQMMDLEKGLQDYEWIGVGRDDGIEKGEYSPIFYNTKRFTEVGSGYFWLSENPMMAGTLGWDAANIRIATWAKLKDLRNGKTIFVLNTHFDHVGEVARRESAKLILQKLHTYTRKNNFPIIVTGDFNTTQNSEVIRSLTDVNNPLHIKDARALSPNVRGPIWSFHNFGKQKEQDRPLLDYVFVRNNVSVLDFETIEGNHGDRWVSDHCPILVKVSY